MKIAIFGESPVDEAVLRLFVDSLVGSPTSLPALPKLRSRGWPAVKRDLPSVIKALHYNSDAEALIVTVDSDNHEVHNVSHDERTDPSNCRHCELWREAENVLAHLAPIQPWHPLRVAVAVPCPSIEAWLLTNRNHSCTEAEWIVRKKSHNSVDEIRKLKRELYGTDAPHADERILAVATEQARLLATDMDLLSRAFPNSFGLLAQCIATWTTGRP